MKKQSRNFNPLMATAAALTIVEVDEIVETGMLSPEEIVTPYIYVDVLVPSEYGVQLNEKHVRSGNKSKNC